MRCCSRSWEGMGVATALTDPTSHPNPRSHALLPAEPLPGPWAFLPVKRHRDFPGPGNPIFLMLCLRCLPGILFCPSSGLSTWMILTVSQQLSLPQPPIPFHPSSQPYVILPPTAKVILYKCTSDPDMPLLKNPSQTPYCLQDKG